MKHNKSDVVKEIASNMALSQTQVSVVLDGLIDHVIAMTGGGGEIHLKGFGVFRSRFRPERNVRNPRTGEILRAPAKTTMIFKAAGGSKKG
jgi:DNA-binding protein HU-beta